MALQAVLRDIDSGKLGRFIKIGMIAVILAGLCVLYFLYQFKGLGTEQAMDQAQIARSLVSGEGFSTRYIRPLAISQLKGAEKEVPSGGFPDFTHAPLHPLLEAAALFPVKKRLTMDVSEMISTGDRAIAFLGIFLLLASVLVWYFAGLRLFDRTVALLAAGLLLVTDLMWQYSISGLPQHLLILLLGLVTLSALKARQSEEEEKTLPTMLWLAAAGLGLGLMSLTHGVTAFLLPGFLLFCYFGFQSRVPAILIPLAVYLLCVFPWLFRNYMVCGNPLGLSSYVALAGSGVTESSLMRGVSTEINLGAGMASKLRNSILDQAAHLWEYLGINIVAVFFLTSVLHPFRNPATSLWRWSVVLMWTGATLGMALFGVKEVISGNQLHVVFLPLFLLYGAAFLLVLWNRLNISFKPLRIAFLSAVFLLAGTPMLITIIIGGTSRIQWPPYVPPFIAVLQTWYKPQELLCSDMPWAVAWYANRKCLLLPETLRAFNEISDYGTLGTPIVGLYLTPVSGRQEFLSLIKGPSKEWGPLIMRTANLNNFLLKSFTPLPIDGECVIYSDSPRWSAKADK